MATPETNYDENGERIAGRMPEQPRAKRKPRFSDLVHPDAVNDLVIKALEMAGNGEVQMLKFVLEQQFGKAAQSMDITSDGEPIPLLSGMTPIENVIHNNDGGQETGEPQKKD